jgi:outer membrane protein TolC
MFLSGPRLWRSVGWALVMWASVPAPALHGADTPNVAGTLPEDYLPELKSILETARRRSPQVIASEIEIALSEARVYAADAPRLPSLAANLNVVTNQTAISGDNSTQNRDQGFFYLVTLNQAIFQWGALKNQSAIADINVQIARKNHAEAQRLLALNLRQQYLGLIARKMAITQTRKSLPQADAAQALEREKLQRGLVPRTQVESRELGLREARLQVARLEEDFAADRRRCARLAGLAELPESAIPSAIPAPVDVAPAAAAVVAALNRDGGRSLFESEIIALRTREADLRYEIAKVRLRPKIFASLGSSLDNATTATPNSVTQQAVTRQTASLNAQWDIFDGLATRGAKQEALTSRRQQENRMAVFTAETMDRAGQLARQLAIDAEAMEISEIQRRMAADGLRQLQQELELGRVARTAVAGAEAGLASSEAANAGARAAYLSRWAELVSLAGMDPVLNNVAVSQNAPSSR